MKVYSVVEAVGAGKPLAEIAKLAHACLDLVMEGGQVRLRLFREEFKQFTGSMAVAIHDGSIEILFPEENSVSQNGYFTRAEAMLRSFDRGEGDGRENWTDGDELSFIIRGRSGRPLVSASITSSAHGPLPERAAVECADLVLQVVGIALERESDRIDREESSSKMVRRADLLEDILRIASSVVSERDVAKVSDMVLTSLSTLFGFERISLMVYDEASGEFKWTALFGYDEDVTRSTYARSVPIDIVLEDLRESRRIGRAAYFTPMDALPRKNLEYFLLRDKISARENVRRTSPDDFLYGDVLAFALHDSTGRVVGVIYPTDPKNRKIPDSETIETIEIFTSLAEVSIENARLSEDRENALRMNGLRMEQLSRIFDIAHDILYVKDVDALLQDVLRALSQLLGIKRLVFGLANEDRTIFEIKAVLGYTDEAVEAITAKSYDSGMIESVSSQSTRPIGKWAPTWGVRVGRMTYYTPAESVKLEPWELVYYPDPDLIRIPRKSKGHWHELDYMDTFVYDNENDVVGYIEILKPRDDRIPDKDTIEIIEIFATLVGIALENARMVHGHIESRRSAEFFTDLLSHDVKNFNLAIMGYLDMLKTTLSKPEQVSLINKVGEQVMNVNNLASDVRVMSRLTWGKTKLFPVDVGKVLLDTISGVRQYFFGKEIKVNHEIETGRYEVMADELLRELFVNLFTNAVKYDTNVPVEIDVNMGMLLIDAKTRRIVVSVADHGVGVPDDLKEEIFERFSGTPARKGTGLGLHIVTMLASRYHGRVWVEDRVAGDHTKGAVFKVEFPSAR